MAQESDVGSGMLEVRTDSHQVESKRLHQKAAFGLSLEGCMQPD
jgi:hypothetical protein